MVEQRHVRTEDIDLRNGYGRTCHDHKFPGKIRRVICRPFRKYKYTRATSPVVVKRALESLRVGSLKFVKSLDLVTADIIIDVSANNAKQSSRCTSNLTTTT